VLWECHCLVQTPCCQTTNCAEALSTSTWCLLYMYSFRAAIGPSLAVWCLCHPKDTSRTCPQHSQVHHAGGLQRGWRC
jgi:hypothetical protein